MQIIRRRPGPLALDLDSHSLHVLQLSGDSSRLRILAWASVPYPQGLSRDTLLTDPLRSATFLRSILPRLSTRERRCWLAVPTAAAITRTLTIPRGLSVREMPGQVWVEAERVLPLGVEELSLDYRVLEGDASGAQPIRLVAARRELVRQMTDMVEGAGLVPEGIGVEDDVLLPALDRLPGPFRGQAAAGGLTILDIQGDGARLYQVDPGRRQMLSRWLPRAVGAPSQQLTADWSSELQRLWDESATGGSPRIWVLTRDAIARACVEGLSARLGVRIHEGHPLADLPIAGPRVAEGAVPPERVSLLVCGLALQAGS